MNLLIPRRPTSSSLSRREGWTTEVERPSNPLGAGSTWVGSTQALVAMKRLGNRGGLLSPFNLFGNAVASFVDRRGSTPPGVPPSMLKAFQADSLPETIHDMDRCGAAVVVFAAVLTGRAAVERLVEHLRGHVRPDRRPLLEQVSKELAGEGLHLTTRAVCYLQDLLFDQNDSEWGSSERDFLRMVEAAGFRIDYEIFGTLRHRAEGLKPKEMMGIQIRRRGRGPLNTGHLMLAGRREDGELYFADSGVSALSLFNGKTYAGERSDPAVFRRYLELVERQGGRTFGGFKFSPCGEEWLQM